MLACPANRCNFLSKTDWGLSVHVGRCKKAKIGFYEIFDDVQQYKHQWAKQCKTLHHGYLEIVPEVDEPMDVDLEVCSANSGYKSKQLMAVVGFIG